MASSAQPASGGASGASRLGFAAGQVVQEFGFGEDVDHDLRSGIESIVGSDLVDEDYDDVCDGAVLWWRDDDGDLVDALVDLRVALDEDGPVWLFTRKPGRSGHVQHGDIEEAASTAGFHAMTTISIAPDWSATKLGSRGL